MKGYAGKYLRVNLGQKKYSAEPLKGEVATKFIGGFGLGAYTLWNEIPKGTDPLSEKNVICWWTGPTAGTIVPASSKYIVAAKSPLTGIFGFGVCSGGFGAELKFAGWDGIVVHGKADKPVYILIDDDVVEFRDASHLWGKDAWETEDMIKRENNDESIKISVIGPSAEKLVKIACINTDKHRQVGRCGMGCVMGSKNLKAIAVRGSQNVEVADLDKLFEYCKAIHEGCQGKATEKYRVFGTPVNVMALNEMGALPTRNFQSGTFEFAEEVSGERMLKTHVRKVQACNACSIGCDHVTLARKESKYAGTVASMDYESLDALGPLCGIHDLDTIIQAVNYCDRFGVDTISAGVILAWAMECYERGILTKNDTDGLDMKFGNGDAMIEALRRMCMREGKFGNLLAGGSRNAARTVGKGAEKYAIQIKGLEYGMYDMRALQTATLGFATCITGAFYQRSGSYQYDTKGTVDRLKLDKTRGPLVSKGEQEYSIVDSLILCKFSRGLYKKMDDSAKIYELVTGVKMSGAELLAAGERIYNLARSFNVREGHGKRKDDYPPERAFEPLNDAVNKGSCIKRNEYDEALDSYYDSCGWSRDGVPTKAKLVSLGLDAAAQEVGV